jgi:ABC-type dipeptide/oligopeptide/nickel transport system permease subunit
MTLVSGSGEARGHDPGDGHNEDGQPSLTLSPAEWVAGHLEAEAATAPLPTPVEEAVGLKLELAFAPIHKRAFGMALGTACALLVFAFTAVHVLGLVEGGYPMLLANYFYGYRISWTGAVIGACWAFGVGFVVGWFVAFCRNLVIAISVFITRTREELKQTREFLDHI